MTVSVAVLVPMLGRPHHVTPLRQSLTDTAPHTRCVWLCTDRDTDTVAACRDTGDQVEILAPRARGDYAAKINHGYRVTSEPWLFLGAADIRFRSGWWQACQRHIDAGALVIGTNDLGNAHTATGKLSTHTLVARDYVDWFGTIDQDRTVLHEGYWHEFVDNEFIDTAQARGAYAHAADAHVEHLHPAWGKAPADGMYDAAALRMGHGHALWKKRRALWT